MPGYGGTERAAYWLGKSLAEKGHKVNFCSHGDSEIPFADVLPIPNDLMDFDSVVPSDVDMVQMRINLHQRPVGRVLRIIFPTIIWLMAISAITKSF